MSAILASSSDCGALDSFDGKRPVRGHQVQPVVLGDEVVVHAEPGLALLPDAGALLGRPRLDVFIRRRPKPFDRDDVADDALRRRVEALRLVPGCAQQHGEGFDGPQVGRLEVAHAPEQDDAQNGGS